MTTVQVKPSPDGVPGAVIDPSALSAQELTFAGAGRHADQRLSLPAAGAGDRCPR